MNNKANYFDYLTSNIEDVKSILQISTNINYGGRVQSKWIFIELTYFHILFTEWEVKLRLRNSKVSERDLFLLLENEDIYIYYLLYNIS